MKRLAGGGKTPTEKLNHQGIFAVSISQQPTGNIEEEKLVNQEEPFQTGRVLTVSAGHAVHDTFAGFLPPMLPELIQTLSLTNTQAGLLAVFLQVPSLIQPWIGRIAGRINLRNVVFLAPAVTAILMSLLGVTPSYYLMILLLVGAGVSSAFFHSVAPVIAGKLSGNRLGRGMSFFMVAGEVGRVLGPLVVVTMITYLGLRKMPWLIILGLLASTVLYIRLKDVPDIPADSGGDDHWMEALRHMVPVLAPMLGIVVVRGFSMAVLSTYLPVFLTEEGAGLWLAGAALSVYELSGVVGAFLGGSLSDRLGRRRVLLFSLSATPVFMLLFLYLLVHQITVVPVLLILGFLILSVNPVLMAIVQERFVENRAFANGVFLAMNFLVRSGVVMFVGILADRVGLRSTFLISTLVVFLGVPFVFLIPKSNPSN